MATKCYSNWFIHAPHRKLFKRKQRGKVGMSLQGDWYEAKPAADPEEARRNVKAAERALEFTIGWFARPLYQGDYPTVMRERVGNRLPRFTREQRAMLKGEDTACQGGLQDKSLFVYV